MNNTNRDPMREISTACELVEAEAVDTIITTERLYPIVESDLTDESIAVLKYSAKRLHRSLSIILDQNRVIADLVKGNTPHAVAAPSKESPTGHVSTLESIDGHRETAFANIEEALYLVSSTELGAAKANPMAESHGEIVLRLTRAWASLQHMECDIELASKPIKYATHETELTEAQL